MLVLANYDILDITLQISDDMKVFPGDVRPKFSLRYDYADDGCRVSDMILGSHTGTHIDAPKHFFKKGNTVDRIPLNQLLGSARIFEFKSKVLQKEDLPKDIKKNEIILIKNLKGKDSFLSINAAEYLVSKKIKAIGCQGLSIESSESNGTVHKKLLSHDIPIIEGLDLDKVKPGRYFFICLPLKLKNFDGAPCRAILLKNK